MGSIGGTRTRTTLVAAAMLVSGLSATGAWASTASTTSSVEAASFAAGSTSTISVKASHDTMRQPAAAAGYLRQVAHPQALSPHPGSRRVRGPTHPGWLRPVRRAAVPHPDPVRPGPRGGVHLDRRVGQLDHLAHPPHNSRGEARARGRQAPAGSPRLPRGVAVGGPQRRRVAPAGHHRCHRPVRVSREERLGPSPDPHLRHGAGAGPGAHGHPDPVGHADHGRADVGGAHHGCAYHGGAYDGCAHDGCAYHGCAHDGCAYDGCAFVCGAGSGGGEGVVEW